LTSVSPDARRLWQVSKVPVLIGLLIVIVGIAVALVRVKGNGGALDPRSYTPSGSHALARLLEGEGVRIERVETFTAAEEALGRGPATLLVTFPERVAPQRLAALRPAELVLIAADDDMLAELGQPVTAIGQQVVADREPECALDAASAAGRARLGGVQYRSSQSCYTGSLARVGTLTVLGDGAPLTNDVLDEHGTAALAMRLLGRHERLVWYVPSPTDTSAWLDPDDAQPGDQSLVDLLPDGWRFGLIQLAIAAAVFALWRARRLGPVVTEPLPVIVRAAETTEGRARLYRKAGAADHAADALRHTARVRLIPRLGLPRGAGATEVVEAVAARTGRTPMAVHEVLYGPPPPDDSALVRLADALDHLEREINR
jgi:hypothetical protein